MKYFNKRSLLYTLITIIVLVLVSGSFYKVVTDDTRKETEAQMRELSKQSISSIAQKLHADAICLHSISETVGNSTMELNTKKLQQYLDRKRGIYGFGDIVVVDLDGKPMSAIGTKLPNMKEQHFYKLALQGKVVLHNGLSLEQTNEHLVRIAQPMRRNGKTIAVLYGVYMPSQLQSMLKENLFDNSATTKLVSSSGDIVAAPQKKSSIYTVEQFFNEADTHISDAEHTRYLGALHNDRQGFATYKHKGQEYLVSLTPMDMGNFSTTDHSRWYLSLAVPYELVASRARVKILQTTGFSLALLAIIGALSFAFYRSNQQKRQELQQAYEEIQSLYRTIPTPHYPLPYGEWWHCAKR